MKTTTIKGIEFINSKRADLRCPIYIKDFYDLYKYPSDTKRQIYEKYRAKLDRIYGIIGNRYYFTIFGGIFDEKGGYHNVTIKVDGDYILD